MVSPSPIGKKASTCWTGTKNDRVGGRILVHWSVVARLPTETCIPLEAGYNVVVVIAKL